jgi:glycosyltransferase involved in cell wall biosynthesis
VVSLGTTVSVNLKDRLWFERTSQKYSIKYLYPRAHRFIVTSKGVADDVQSFTGRTFENIAIVPRPVISEELYERHFPLPDHTWFRQKEKPVILGVGELSSRKDFSTLLKAFSRIHSQRECRLMILGQGKQRFLLLQLAQNLGLENDFCLPGYVPDPYRYMRHADCFVLSSRWEGLGFVLIEALAVGTPVVSTRCPSGPEEILHNGMYGKLVPVGDDKTMAEAIGQTLQSPLPRTFLQKASFPYTLGRSADAYLQAMRD